MGGKAAVVQQANTGAQYCNKQIYLLQEETICNRSKINAKTASKSYSVRHYGNAHSLTHSLTMGKYCLCHMGLSDELISFQSIGRRRVKWVKYV